MIRLAASLLLAMLVSCFTPRASLPVFDRGPVTNLVPYNDAAWTNASAHIGWSLALGLAGYALDGRRGLRIACGAWASESLVGEAFFHAPPGPLGPSYASEVRTDLLTKFVPCGLLTLAETLR
jgi:hypothetical protein